VADNELTFRLPVDGWPRATFRTNFSYQGGKLMVDGSAVAEARTRQELEAGITGSLPDCPDPIQVRLIDRKGVAEVVVHAGERRAPRESELSVKASRSAWIHALQALAGSFAGFVASYLYLLKAQALGSEWAMKMGVHTAGWHLLLTFTLFPASVWGQRMGIRAVQFVSLVFFCIHLGIAIANIGPSDAANPDDPWIALFNALSGLFFLVATFYGNRAHRDMDPLGALKPLST